MTAEAHHDALVARLKAHSQLGTSVFELGAVPTVNPPARYVVVASSLGDWDQLRLSGSKDALLTSHVLYCVGNNSAAARKVGTWVTEQMKDHRLTVAGRQAFCPDPWISRPIQIDKDGPIVLPFATIAFDILSEPV
ncbi:hypothetical protein J2X63_003178 [Agromyces sp. 3263]|uniref:hypothetical protein n=1 Tax=Agromyces sp. 3263 TaxID=2817750 RepID=UPI00285F15E3|nr:hypothetical protein [Agromyces sp. 3263]MDR6907470.1 hypothetical protein [Agromyces sp. 3263]